MNPMAQPNLHPDADRLNAFVEHALPEAERLGVVAHLAECAHCREVVFLARAAAGADTLASPVVEQKHRPGWFAAAMARWRIALIPAGALAAFSAALLWLQVHPVAMYKRAASPPSSAALPAAPPSVLKPKKEAASAAEVEARQDAPQAASAAAAKAAPTLPRANPKHNAFAASAILAAPPVSSPKPGAGADAAIGSIHLDARSAAMTQYAPALPPPRAVRPEQAQDLARSQSMQAPTAVAALPAPSAPGQSPTEHPSSQPHPASPAFSQAAPRAARGTEISAQQIHELAYTRIAGHVRLPSGQNTVSSAAVLNRMVALDAAGGLFRSEDGGTNWVPVPVVWSGKAVEVNAPSLQVSRNLFAVRTAPPAQNQERQAGPAPPNAALNASTDPAPPAPPPTDAGPTRAAAKIRTNSKGGPPVLLPLFHLVTDRHEVWVSSDGKEWRPRSIPPG
jgi:Putative zinc-finger